MGGCQKMAFGLKTLRSRQVGTRSPVLLGVFPPNDYVGRDSLIRRPGLNKYPKKIPIQWLGWFCE